MEVGKFGKRYEYSLTALFFFTWGFVFLDRLAMTFLNPIVMPVLNLNNTQIGVVGFVTTGCFAVSAAVFGMLSDRSGFRKRWLVPFTFATAIFSGLCALVQNYEQLLILRALVGIAEGPILPLIYVLLSSASPSNTYGRNTGVVNAGVAILAVTIGPALLTNIAGAASWQVAFLAASLPTLVCALVMMPLVKEVKIERPVADSSVPQESIWSKYKRALKQRNIVLCILIATVGFAGYWTMLIYAPVYFVNAMGKSPENMGFIVSAMGFVCMAYTIIIPWLSDRFGRRPVMGFSYALSILYPLAMFLFVDSSLPVYIYILLGGIPGSMTPLFASIVPIETVEADLQGTCSGMILGLGEVIGGSIFPVIAGRIADTQGLPATMLTAAILFAITAVFGFMLTECNPAVLARKGKAPKEAA